jgi:hypothetical protein
MLTWEIVPRYAALALICGLGFMLRSREKTQMGPLLLGSVAGSLIFYVITNTGAWLGDPGYAKTAGEWVRAMTTGLPGFPPTWWFYKHTLISDVLFTAIFAFSMSARRSGLPAPAPAAAGQSSA